MTPGNQTKKHNIKQISALKGFPQNSTATGGKNIQSNIIFENPPFSELNHIIYLKTKNKNRV